MFIFALTMLPVKSRRSRKISPSKEELGCHQGRYRRRQKPLEVWHRTGYSSTNGLLLRVTEGCDDNGREPIRKLRESWDLYSSSATDIADSFPSSWLAIENVPGTELPWLIGS